MVLDFGDFFIKLEDLDKKVKDAEAKLTNLAIRLGISTKIRAKDARAVEIKEVASTLSEAYEVLGKSYSEVKEEFSRILKQVQEVSTASTKTIESLKDKVSAKKKDAILKSLNAYRDIVDANSYFYQADSKLNTTMNDFASVIGQVKGIVEVIQGFQSEDAPSTKEIKKLQRSIDEITERYIW
ncbi:MAG: hypothetical protein V3T58_01190 [Candidatus Hydrothermarchaeales archaeon]